MLQRAASNAYSWWWASHIRTTQSKWLDTNLHEMEARVKAMIKLIEADADSFAKKAELYFKSRPELISYVEETYRSYQALADRYDRISGELHKANHTIATAFPDQVQLSMQDEGGDGFPKAITGIDLSKFQPQPMEASRMSLQDVNTETGPTLKKSQHRRISSHMSKEKAQEEIDRLQKKILVLQTEKEFLKSSYETGLTKYLDIERQVTEVQDEICSLQDDFSTSAIIEDNEARALMAARAIISCEDTLVSLQDQQKRSSEEARTEFQRIKEARHKLKTFKSECGQSDAQSEPNYDQDIDQSSTMSHVEDDDSVLDEGRLELQSICQKVKQQFELCSEASVVELAEKVDELVDKVISLELAASSQSAQVNRMKTEADELHKRLHDLEEDKMALIGDSNALAERLKQVEEVLENIQRIGKSVQAEKGNIHKQLNEACNDLSDFVEKLDTPEHQNTPDSKDVSEEEKGATSQPRTLSNLLEDDSGLTSKAGDKESSDSVDDSSNEVEAQDEESEEPVVWQQLVLNGLEGKDKILLKEYTSILRNYKDTKKRLSHIEKKNQEYHLETMTEVKELKSANAMKDDEIRSLRRMLSSLQTKLNSSDKSESSKTCTSPIAEDKEIAEIEEYIKQCQVEEQQHHSSAAEEKFRAEIDRVLEENLDFWLRFSTSYHQIQSFQKTFDKQKVEMAKLTDAKAHEDKATLEKKFRELNTDLQVWLEKNVLLKGEVESRFSSLCRIQEDISKITTLGGVDGVHFTPFQAAKFQGEVLNMKQENNKVSKELEAGLDHVRGLQVEVGRALVKLRESFELSVTRSNRAQQNFRNLSTKAGVPLRTFLFGTKPKKPSIFSCMSPAVQKQYSDMRAGLFR